MNEICIEGWMEGQDDGWMDGSIERNGGDVYLDTYRENSKMCMYIERETRKSLCWENERLSHISTQRYEERERGRERLVASASPSKVCSWSSGFARLVGARLVWMLLSTSVPRLHLDHTRCGKMLGESPESSVCFGSAWSGGCPLGAFAPCCLLSVLGDRPHNCC